MNVASVSYLSSSCLPTNHRRSCGMPPMAFTSNVRLHTSTSNTQLLQKRFQSSSSSRCRLQIQCAVRKQSQKSVLCSKTLVALEGHEENVEKLCKEIVDYSRSQMSDKDKGILEFACSKDGFEDNTFHFFERYTTNTTMGEHNSSEVLKEFMEKIQEHLEGPVGMALYEMIDGKLSNNCIQGGPKGEGGLDDATGAAGTAGGAGLKQTSATLDLGNVTRGDDGDAFGMGGAGFKFPWQK